MRMPLRFKKTLLAFASRKPVQHWIEQGSYDDKGVWVKKAFPRRTIKAVILTLTPEELGFYAQGNSSQGGVAIHTLEELFISDVDRGGIEARQSYIEWNGYTFRISGTGFATPNSDHFTYIGLQYTDYGNANG